MSCVTEKSDPNVNVNAVDKIKGGIISKALF